MHASTSPTSSTPQLVTLAITGMSCGHCVAAVTDTLEQLPGVDVRQVSIGSAAVALEPGTVSTVAVIDAIREAGYAARVAAHPLPQAAFASCCSPRGS